MPIPLNVKQFYLDERRRASCEVAFGLEWTVSSDPDATYGVHWIEATKEVYVLRGPKSPIFLPNSLYGGASTVAPRFADDEYEVIVLGKVASKEVLGEALEGWEEQMAGPTSLQLIRERLDDATDSS